VHLTALAAANPAYRWNFDCPLLGGRSEAYPPRDAGHMQEAVPGPGVMDSGVHPFRSFLAGRGAQERLRPSVARCEPAQCWRGSTVDVLHPGTGVGLDCPVAPDGGGLACYARRRGGVERRRGFRERCLEPCASCRARQPTPQASQPARCRRSNNRLPAASATPCFFAAPTTATFHRGRPYIALSKSECRPARHASKLKVH
jgi:hypothetical protein